MSSAQIVAALTSPENIIIFLGTVGTFLTVIAFALPFLQRDALAPRLKAVAARREELRLQATAQQAASQRPGHKEAITAMRRILGRLNLMNQLEDRELRMRLARAGWRGYAPIVTFVFGRVLLPLVLALVVAFGVFVLDMFKLEPAMKLVAVMGGAVMGYYIPNVVVKNVTQKRQDLIRLGFPDTLDLTIICVEAGLSLEAAVTASTSRPAQVLGLEDHLGSLKPGMSGDAAVFDLREGRFVWHDMAGHNVEGKVRFDTFLTVRGGSVAWREGRLVQMGEC